MDSLIQCFLELDLHFAVITESWLKDDQRLRDALVDLNEGENINMLTMNRKTRNGRCVAGGGIAIAYNKSKVVMSEMKIRRGKSEILCANCKVPNLSRRLVVIGTGCLLDIATP